MVGPWRTLRGQVPTVSTAADLRNTEGRSGAVVYLLGRASDGDGGEGLFAWEAGTTTGDDDGTVFVSTTGRWVRQWQGSVSAAWFGALGDGVTDCYDAIQGAVDVALAAGVSDVTVPTGECLVSSTVHLGARDGDSTDYVTGLRLSGEGRPFSEEGTVLKWSGGVAEGPILRIRNASGVVLSRLGFDGNETAEYCLQITHVLGDTGVTQNWRVVDCWVKDATVSNVLIGEPSGTSYGDCSAGVFESLYGAPSTSGNHTPTHVLQTAQYTFGVLLNSCRLASDGTGYPEVAVRLYGGTVTVIGGTMDLQTDAAVVLEGHPDDPLVPFGAVCMYNVEVQSANKLLRTDFLSYATAAPQRSCVLSGVSHSDISGPVSATSIYWDLRSFAALVLDGCRLQGDVEVANTEAKVFVTGTIFESSPDPRGFTGVGLDRVSGEWLVGPTAAGVFQHRKPDLATYADDAAAVSGGLTTGTLYKTSAGVVMVVL